MTVSINNLNLASSSFRKVYVSSAMPAPIGALTDIAAEAVVALAIFLTACGSAVISGGEKNEPEPTVEEPPVETYKLSPYSQCNVYPPENIIADIKIINDDGSPADPYIIEATKQLLLELDLDYKLTEGIGAFVMSADEDYGYYDEHDYAHNPDGKASIYTGAGLFSADFIADEGQRLYNIKLHFLHEICHHIYFKVAYFEPSDIDLVNDVFYQTVWDILGVDLDTIEKDFSTNDFYGLRWDELAASNSAAMNYYNEWEAFAMAASQFFTWNSWARASIESYQLGTAFPSNDCDFCTDFSVGVYPILDKLVCGQKSYLDPSENPLFDSCVQFYTIDSLDEAKDCFNALIERYPDGEHYQEASDYLDLINN